MNVVQIQGGLGNQMFQYAFGRMLGENTFIDDYFMRQVRPDTTPRQFELNQFQCELKRIPHPIYFKHGKSLWSPVGLVGRYFRKCSVPEPTAFLPNLRTLNGRNFIGYFQNEKYFKFSREVLLKDFSLSNPKDERYVHWKSLIRQCENAVSVHIRRGDYIHLPSFQLCDMAYYQDAISFIKSAVGNPSLFVFSDDMAWARANLSTDSPVHFISESWTLSSYDMMLMKHCRHNIIANSTYSWWGAWLNENPDKIVVAPSRWSDHQVASEIVPPDWKMI